VADLSELASRVERAEGANRELDAEIMFDLYAKPVGQHADDGGPTGYLWPEDSASWAFGIRFPGKDRAWCHDVRKRSDGETLVIERDGAVVLMNNLRVPKLTASLDAALTLLGPGYWWIIGKGKTTATEPTYGAQVFAAGNGQHPIGEAENDASAALALCAAALRARAREGE